MTETRAAAKAKAMGSGKRSGRSKAKTPASKKNLLAEFITPASIASKPRSPQDEDYGTPASAAEPVEVHVDDRDIKPFSQLTPKAVVSGSMDGYGVCMVRRSATVAVYGRVSRVQPDGLQDELCMTLYRDLVR